MTHLHPIVQEGLVGFFSFFFFYKVYTLIVFSLGNFGFNSYDLLTFGLMVMGAGNKIDIVRFIFYDHDFNHNLHFQFQG